jgi:low affinity Fe/Cu permease
MPDDDHSLEDSFDRFASTFARLTGHAGAFAAAVALVLVWAISGPVFGFSDTWQLVINTGTTVLTFLMVFVIQNSLNRDSAALHVKLDELIRVTNEARNALMGSEHLSERELERLRRDEESRGTDAQLGSGGAAGD